jgi:Predicted nucleotide-binding protein containing TIR-like domain
MKIAVVGSWRDGDREWGLRGTHADFERACFSIGQELGRRRQAVVVGGQSSSTADLHVVRGIIDAVRGHSVHSPLIEVLRPAGDFNSYEDLARTNPELFSFHVPTQTRWNEAHLLSLREAEVVLAIAGMRGTYLAGLAAILAKKKLVPVASFGGAAERLSASLEAIGEPRLAGEYRRLNGPWTERSLEVVIKLTGIGMLPRVLLIHGRSPDWLRVKDWLREKIKIDEIVVMQQEFGDGRTLPEKFEQLASRVDKAIAIATPDDVGGLSTAETSALKRRARQNVWLEAGWFWGRFGRNNLLVLSRGEIEFPSDLTGLEVYAYQEDPTERAEKLRAYLGSN